MQGTQYYLRLYLVQVIQLSFIHCVHEKTAPLSIFFAKLARVAQFQFNSMNMCLFSIKVPILVKICPTVIEILTFNKWYKKFTISRRVIYYLQSIEVTDVSIDAIAALAKQKQTKWCLVPKILF